MLKRDTGQGFSHSWLGRRLKNSSQISLTNLKVDIALWLYLLIIFVSFFCFGELGFLGLETSCELGSFLPKTFASEDQASSSQTCWKPQLCWRKPPRCSTTAWFLSTAHLPKGLQLLRLVCAKWQRWRRHVGLDGCASKFGYVFFPRITKDSLRSPAELRFFANILLLTFCSSDKPTKPRATSLISMPFWSQATSTFAFLSFACHRYGTELTI